MGRTALGSRKGGRHIVLAGAMGVGKSRVGGLLAERMGVTFLDSDEVLEEATGEIGSEIAVRDGVERLHELELEVFLQMCEEPESAVIAPAASVVDQEAGRKALTENLTVWLTAPGEVLAQRQREGAHRRSVSSEEQVALQIARAPLLEEVSAIIMDTASSTPAEIVAELLDLLRESPSVSGSD
jgi:shikimate kinase